MHGCGLKVSLGVLLMLLTMECALGNPNIHKRLGPKKNKDAHSSDEKLLTDDESNRQEEGCVSGAGLKTYKAANALVEKRGLADLDKAVELYQQLRKTCPDDVDLQLSTAKAINAGVRIRTNANTILIEGHLDQPEFKKVWQEQGVEALRLAKNVIKERPDDVDALAVYADSFFFANSGKDPWMLVFSGAWGSLYQISYKLIRNHTEHDSGIGFARLGHLFVVAPWPLGSLHLAMGNLDLAVQINPSKRNLYMSAVIAYRRKQWAKAAEFFDMALKAKCGSWTEEDIGDFLDYKSKEGLVMAQQHEEERTRLKAAEAGGICDGASGLSVERYRGVLWVTLAYFLMYYTFLTVQSQGRQLLRKQMRAAGDQRSVDSHPSQIRWDRTVGNTLEQMGPFLFGLWSHALFVDPTSAANIGWGYIVARSFYPLVHISVQKSIFLLGCSTGPGYICIAVLLGQVFFKTLQFE